jgi:hypothetical protein
MPEITPVNFDEVLLAFEREAFPSHAPDRPALEEACVDAARLGWHGCSPSAAWPVPAEGAVREYFRDELTDDVLATHGQGASRWALFASYATGWLFCLQGHGRLDDLSAANAFATLPGFMWMNAVRVAGGEPFDQ